VPKMPSSNLPANVRDWLQLADGRRVPVGFNCEQCNDVEARYWHDTWYCAPCWMKSGVYAWLDAIDTDDV